MKTRFLEESPGVQSWQRLQSLLMLAFFFVITGYQVFTGKEIQFEFTTLLMVGALAPKLIQKFAEAKNSKTNNAPVKES